MTPQMYRAALGSDLVVHALSRDLERTVMVLSDGTTVSAGQLRDSISSIQQALEALSPRSLRAAVIARNRVEVPAIMTALGFAGIVATALHPMGAIEAFRVAFPLGTEDVTLTIKARGNPSEPVRDELYHLASSDQRIQIREELLSRQEMSALMQECNVFLSLHRSEGFGLGCAEALAHGKIVVATDFGGTKDFISNTSGYPVSFKQVPLSRKDYPGAEGSYWAEPDTEHAASILKEIYANPTCSSDRPIAGYHYLKNNNSFLAVGRAIRDHLATNSERH